jgi:hypothetical protein
MTRPWRECRYKRLSQRRSKKKAMAVADQSNLTATVSIADIAAETENDW